MSGAKRRLSSGTPSPSTTKPAKALRMATTPPAFQGQASGTNLDKNYLRSLLSGKDINKLHEIADEEKKWDFVITAFQSVADKLECIEKENIDLKMAVQSSKGKIIRLEQDLDRAQRKILELEWHRLQSNVVIYNCPEQDGEVCKNLITEKLGTELGVPTDLIHTVNNPSGTIGIDIAYRIGRQSGKPRPIVVKLTTVAGKSKLMEICSKSRGKTTLRVADHYPPEIRERRNAQISDLKHHQNLHKGTGTKVKLVGDELKIGNQVNKQAFEKNKLQSIPLIASSDDLAISHTPILEVKGSYFQGHAAEINSIRHAAEIRDGLFQSPHVANAHHLIYAYSINDETGMRITGHSDDGEWAASKLLETLLADNQTRNLLVAVSRRHDGPNLGKQRFSSIVSVAKEAIDLLDSEPL